MKEISISALQRYSVTVRIILVTALHRYSVTVRIMLVTMYNKKTKKGVTCNHPFL